MLSDTNNSDVTDSNETEAKDIDTDDNVQLSKDESRDLVQNQENETEIDDTLFNEKIAKELVTDEITAVQKDDTNADNTIKKEDYKKNIQIKSMGSLNNDEEVAIKKVSIVNYGDSKIKREREIISMNDNVPKVKVDEIKQKTIDDEDYIQDEELDHEVDEEEIKSSTDNFNEINDSVSFYIKLY